jgi:hypothetical protein
MFLTISWYAYAAVLPKKGTLIVAWLDPKCCVKPSRLCLLLCAVQTYNVACEWIQVLQQMFQASGLPLMALIANKADTEQLQALAAEIQPGPTNEVCDGGICRWEA